MIVKYCKYYIHNIMFYYLLYILKMINLSIIFINLLQFITVSLSLTFKIFFKIYINFHQNIFINLNKMIMIINKQIIFDLRYNYAN